MKAATCEWCAKVGERDARDPLIGIWRHGNVDRDLCVACAVRVSRFAQEVGNGQSDSVVFAVTREWLAIEIALADAWRAGLAMTVKSGLASGKIKKKRG